MRRQSERWKQNEQDCHLNLQSFEVHLTGIRVLQRPHIRCYFGGIAAPLGMWVYYTSAYGVFFETVWVLLVAAIPPSNGFNKTEPLVNLLL